jgi:hypothetical protein
MHQLRLFDLEGVNRADEQVGEIVNQPSVDPECHLAVVFSDGVRLNHQLVTVPLAALWQPVGHGDEIRILRSIGQPIAVIPD